MDEAVYVLKPKQPRKPNTELDSRSFRDGAIFLFKRAGYKKTNLLVCRLQLPNGKRIRIDRGDPNKPHLTVPD
jgi:hypothetical protein